MDKYQSFSSDQSIAIQLEVVPDDERPADMADVEKVGRSLFHQLTQSGYTVKPVSTGRKGIELLYEIFSNALTYAVLAASFTPFFEFIMFIRERLEEGKGAPFKITLEVDGKTVTIKTEESEEVINLLMQFQKNQFDTVKMKVHVSKEE